MQASIKQLNKMGVNPVQVHCLASELTITSNDGELQSEVTLNESIVQRYLIKAQ